MANKSGHIWTPERDAIFWDAFFEDLPNAEIARRCGVTVRQVLNHKRNDAGNCSLAYFGRVGEWPEQKLRDMNASAVEALREHHPDLECW